MGDRTYVVVQIFAEMTPSVKQSIDAHLDAYGFSVPDERTIFSKAAKANIPTVGYVYTQDEANPDVDDDIAPMLVANGLPFEIYTMGFGGWSGHMMYHHPDVPGTKTFEGEGTPMIEGSAVTEYLRAHIAATGREIVEQEEWERFTGEAWTKRFKAVDDEVLKREEEGDEATLERVRQEMTESLDQITLARQRAEDDPHDEDGNRLTPPLP